MAGDSRGGETASGASGDCAVGIVAVINSSSAVPTFRTPRKAGHPCSRSDHFSPAVNRGDITFAIPRLHDPSDILNEWPYTSLRELPGSLARRWRARCWRKAIKCAGSTTFLLES